MAILSSTKSRRRASSNPQVPLVIISQPLPGPITGQSSPAPQVRPETANQSSADASTEPVLEVNHICSEPDESPSSTNVTSLPVANDQPTSEDTPTAGEEEAVVVSLTSCPRKISSQGEERKQNK